MTTPPGKERTTRSLDDDLGLLPTKLARPRVPPTFLARPQVDLLMDSGSRGPLTVVSAGPGWGKTLSTAAWATSEPRRVAWLSLDEDDNEPRRFWSYFVAALREARAVPPSNPLAQLAPGLGDERAFTRRLLSGLARLPSIVVVVLDDFHLISAPAVLANVTELLRHRVDQLRLIVLTRSDPILPLHRLRMSDDLTEIRARDLGFDVAEAAALLNRHGVQVPTDDVQLLVDRTEGWPAGLRLAALFLTRQDPPRRVADFAGEDQTVTSYLAEEVLASQSLDMRRFLLRTSISERLSSGLAGVLTDQPHAQERLESLEASNAFVVGLGPRRQWFRYHTLLREMLRHRLLVEQPDVVPDLHRLAAQWFADNGFAIEALSHAAEAADWPLLGQLFVKHAFPLLVSTDRLTVAQVLARIPASRLVDTPELTLCAAARLFHERRFQDMQPHLDSAAARMDEAGPASRRAIGVTRLLLCAPAARSHGDMPTLMENASEALDLVSSKDSAFDTASASRGIALGNLGVGLLWTGQLAAAKARLEEGLAEAEGSRVDLSKVNILAHLSIIAMEAGTLRSAVGYATRAVELVESRGWAPLPQAATAYLTLSMAHLLWDNVAEAQALLTQGRSASLPEPAPRLALGLAQVRLDANLGRVHDARALLLGLRHDVGNWQPPPLLSRWWTVAEAEVELTAGDPVAAAALIGDVTDSEPRSAREAMCLARALFASGDQKECDAVLASLVRAVGQADGQEGVRVEMWLLAALLADSLRQDNRALEAMERAVLVASLAGIRRPFLDSDDEHIQRLLARLKEVNPGVTRVVDELTAYLSVASGPFPPSVPGGPLTDRELMILRYLPTMMTNVEIAAQLFVSVNTVKAHLKHIYSKLEVDTRRQAAQRARELGLLLDPGPTKGN